MDISIKQLNRLVAFLDGIERDAYSEPLSIVHSQVTQVAVRILLGKYCSSGTRILDIGCGQGPALELFRNAGLQAIGVALNETDVRACQNRGFDAYVMDQSFLAFEDASFDIIWARHVLEHSIMPLYTLHEFYRVLRPGGILYVEVPASDTIARHEENPNHYSMLTRRGWEALFVKSGYQILEYKEYPLLITAGPDAGHEDMFWGFYCCKVS